jgi:tetratricopeptide (TPR) repeat protein
MSPHRARAVSTLLMLLPALPILLSARAEQRRAVSFNKDVAPVMFASCAPCHHPDGPAPFSLLTYADVARRGSLIAAVTHSRYMPPWKPEPGSGTFVGERRLSAEQIALIERWVQRGMVEGDPHDLPPAPTWTPGWQLGQPDLIVPLPEYTLPADGRDVFRLFVVPVQRASARYVRGLEFRAASPAIHHANIRIDYSDASRRLDEADPEPGYEGLISSSAEYPDGHFLGWTPGQVAPLAPHDLAWRLSPGADFVVQLHLRPTGKPERIHPLIGLFFSNEAPTRIPAMMRLGRQNIDIPAGDARYRSEDSYTLPVDVQVQAIQPHSHYRATQVRVSATLPDRTTRELIQIDRWDFAWQDVYRVSDPYWLPAGTEIHSQFTFDNSSRNPRNPESPPQRALWGFRSSDEMADAWIQVLTRLDADRQRLVASFRRKATTEDAVGYELRLRMDPTNTVLHDELAAMYIELGRPDDALRHFAATATLRPASATAHHNLGTVFERMNRPGDATAEYERAVALDPRYARARINLGNMLLRRERVDEAAAQYREAIALDPDSAEAHNNLGRVLVGEGRLTEAVGHLNRALLVRPTYADAHFNLADALARQGLASAAIRHYRDALHERLDWPPALVGLSWILSSDRDPAVRRPDEAVQLAKRAIKASSGDDPTVLDALAAAHASAGQFDKAVTTATTALTVATRAGATDLARAIERRLELYRERRPYVATDR